MSRNPLYLHENQKMKHIYRLFIALLTVFAMNSCSSLPANDTSALPDMPQDTLIDFIKARATPRNQFLNMAKGHWKWKTALENAEAERILARCSVSNDTLFVDTHFRFIAFDYRELDDLFLFTIARYDPSGDSSELFHFTLDKKEHLLISCTKIGKWRKDRLYEYNSRLSYAKDGRSLIVNARSDRKKAQKGIPVIAIGKTSVRYDFFGTGTKSRLLHEAHKEVEETVIAAGN